MSVEVRIPARDAPNAARVLLVAAVSLAAGLALAWWGAESERAETSASVASDSTPVEEAELERAPVESPEVAEEAPVERAEVDVEAPAEEAAAAAAAPEPVAVASDSDTAAGSSLRVVRGRVAYIRCDGVRGCPRDEALEATVWPILDALPACSTAPSAPGEADIRIDYRGDAAPDIGWRDTFPSDTVRLDRERVLGCVSAALSETRQSLGAEWLRVSFRFALVAP